MPKTVAESIADLFEDPAYVMLDVAAVARAYRNLEREYSQRSEDFTDALEGTSIRLNRQGSRTLMEKSVTAGFLSGQAWVYGKIAEQFEHLAKQERFELPDDVKARIADLERRTAAL